MQKIIVLALLCMVLRSSCLGQQCSQRAKLGIGSVTKVSGTQVNVEICLFPEQANTSMWLGVGGYIDVLVPAGMGTTATIVSNNNSGSVYAIDAVNSSSTHVAVRLEDGLIETTWNSASASKNVQFILQLTIPSGQCDGSSTLQVQTTYDRYGTLGIPEVIDISASCSLTQNLPVNSAPVDICPMLTLPVQLASFNVVAMADCQNKIEWLSASEKDFSKYEVEYSSNGAQFVKIGEVAGLGNNMSYTYMHSAGKGNSFYRLKMMDMDGKVEYSNVVLVRNSCDGRTLAVLYPNPAQSATMLGNLGTGEKRITLYDASGKLLLSQSTTSSQYLIDLGRYTRGVYMLKLDKEEESTQVFKLIKE